MARLRIIAGEFGGRFISADVGRGTHPMGDRVRSGMFASLASRGALSGARVLDAFAGTGAVGLEALSRGASSVVFIESDKVAAKVIQQNIDTLGVGDRAKVINTTVANWLQTRDLTDEFDLILADPPYNRPQFSTVFRLAEALKSKGLMVLSYLCQVKGVSRNLTKELLWWMIFAVTEKRLLLFTPSRSPDTTTCCGCVPGCDLGDLG